MCGVGLGSSFLWAQKTVSSSNMSVVCILLQKQLLDVSFFLKERIMTSVKGIPRRVASVRSLRTRIEPRQ